MSSITPHSLIYLKNVFKIAWGTLSLAHITSYNTTEMKLNYDDHQIFSHSTFLTNFFFNLNKSRSLIYG